MTSQKRIKANRRNALKSTGPKTLEGKATVSKNAIRHGLRARHTVIEGESRIEFNEFSNELIRHLAPVGFLEQLLADRLIAAFWHLHRVARIEVELFNYLQQPEPTPLTGSCNNDTQKPETGSNYSFITAISSADNTRLNILKSSIVPSKYLSGIASLPILNDSLLSILPGRIEISDVDGVPAST